MFSAKSSTSHHRCHGYCYRVHVAFHYMMFLAIRTGFPPWELNYTLFQTAFRILVHPCSHSMLAMNFFFRCCPLLNPLDCNSSNFDLFFFSVNRAGERCGADWEDTESSDENLLHQSSGQNWGHHITNHMPLGRRGSLEGNDGHSKFCSEQRIIAPKFGVSAALGSCIPTEYLSC